MPIHISRIQENDENAVYNIKTYQNNSAILTSAIAFSADSTLSNVTKPQLKRKYLNKIHD